MVVFIFISTLVNNALTFYSEIGESTKKNDTKHLASDWMANSSFMDNTAKVISVKLVIEDKFKIEFQNFGFSLCKGLFGFYFYCVGDSSKTKRESCTK